MDVTSPLLMLFIMISQRAYVCRRCYKDTAMALLKQVRDRVLQINKLESTRGRKDEQNPTSGSLMKL